MKPNFDSKVFQKQLGSIKTPLK